MFYGVARRALYIGPGDLLLIIAPCEIHAYTRGAENRGQVNDRGTNKTGTVVVSQKSTSGRRAARVRAGLQPLERCSVANRGGKKGLAALHGPLANTKLLFLYRGAKMFTALGRGMYQGVPTDAERGAWKKQKTKRSLAHVPAGNTNKFQITLRISRI